MVIFIVNTRASTKIFQSCAHGEMACVRLSLFTCSMLQGGVAKDKHYEQGRLLDFEFRVRLQRQSTCSKLATHTSVGLTVHRSITLTLPASKSVVGLVFDGKPRLVSVGPLMTRLQQGCPSNNSPTADFDEQRLHCIKVYSSPRKCVHSLL